MSLVKTSLESLKVNPFELIGRDWFLITSGTSASEYNTMTASWGSMGIMWGKPVFTCGIRHNRYTFEFSEKNDLITFSFFDSDKYRPMLSFCGSKSGRDHDKARKHALLLWRSTALFHLKKQNWFLCAASFMLRILKRKSLLTNRSSVSMKMILFTECIQQK